MHFTIYFPATTTLQKKSLSVGVYKKKVLQFVHLFVYHRKRNSLEGLKYNYTALRFLLPFEYQWIVVLLCVLDPILYSAHLKCRRYLLVEDSEGFVCSLLENGSLWCPEVLDRILVVCGTILTLH